MVSIVRGFLLGVSLTPAAYRGARPTSGGTRARSHAGAPVARHGDLPYPLGQLALGRHDQRGDVALVVFGLLADRTPRDERVARPVPGECELALPLARQRDVASWRVALQRRRDDI